MSLITEKCVYVFAAVRLARLSKPKRVILSLGRAQSIAKGRRLRLCVYTAVYPGPVNLVTQIRKTKLPPACQFIQHIRKCWENHRSLTASRYV